MAEHVPGNARLAARKFGCDQPFQDPLPPPDAPLAPCRLPLGSYTTVEAIIVSLVQAIARVWSEAIYGHSGMAGAT